MNKKKKGYIALILVCVFAFGVVVGGATMMTGMLHVGNSVLVDSEYMDRVNGIADKYAKLEALYMTIDQNYYGDYTDEALMEGIYDGLFSALDKYSVYMTPEEYKTTTETTTSSFSGIGVVMTVNDDNQILIIQVYEDSPAEKAGVKPGDIITEVEGVSYTGDELDVASAKLRGERGTKVTMTVMRDNSKIAISMIRNTINSETIATGLLTDEASKGHKIGYVRIASFGNGTADEFGKILRDMEIDGTEGFILDLRYNGGGVVDTAIAVADMLVEEGIIMTTKTRKGVGETFTSDAKATDLPYVVLVNGSTASAAEILTAAIKGNGAAEVIGETTFGKGVVQYVAPIGKDGDAIKLTYEEYFGPNELKINGVGIEPDKIITYNAEDTENDNQFMAATEELLKLL